MARTGPATSLRGQIGIANKGKSQRADALSWLFMMATAAAAAVV